MKLAASRASSRHVELARFVIGDIWLRPMPLASQRPRPTMGRGFVLRSSARRSSVPVVDNSHTFASSLERGDNDFDELLHARQGAKYRIKEKCHDPMPNRVSRRLQEVPSILSLSIERCRRRLPERRRNADQASSRRERQEVGGQKSQQLGFPANK